MRGNQNNKKLSKTDTRDSNGFLVVYVNRCKSCIFNDGQKVISESRLVEIKNYLINGISHTCHATNFVCLGSREFQATIFYRMGIIKETNVHVLSLEIKNSIKNGMQ